LISAGATNSSLLNDTKIYVTSGGINKQLSQAITDGDIGGSGGGINYITNGRAESDTTGWATYADAAGTNPVDGTGGSPSSTFTRSTSSPLRGSGSFLWTKSAANRQGEGFSYAFTIADEDKGKVLQGVLNYAISSGTYADDDMTIWIYDVTNAALIQPAPYKIKNHLLVCDKIPFEFQTASNSNSYRLIVHTASTSAVAYTIKLDDISVGPTAKLYGSPVTDPVAYTPTFTGFGTPSSVNFKSWRVGKILYVTGTFVNGTPTATEGRITLGFGGVSGNVTTASTLPALSRVGDWSDTGTSSTTDFRHRQVLIEVSKTYMVFGAENSTANGSLTKQNGNGVSGAGTTISIEAAFEIEGWSSSVVMSTDANTNVVAFSANDSNTAATTSVPFKYTTITQNTTGSYDSSTGKFTAPMPGTYYFYATVYSASAGNNLLLYKNGSAIAQGPVQTNASYPAMVSWSGPMNASDTMEVRPGASITASPSATTDIFYGFRLSGPSQIAASENVSALYTGAPATGTLTGSFNTTTFGTLVKDTHGAYSGGTYTVPISGTYSVAATAEVTATYILGKYAQIGVYVNGVQKAVGYILTAAAVSDAGPSVHINSLPLLAGDLVTIKYYCDATGPAYASTAAYNYFSIVRTGNY
jgi:hypothetical protein